MPRLYAMTLPLSTYNMLDFNNTEIAFSSKSRGELQNAYWLFNTIKYPWLVKCAKVATSIALKIHFPLAWAVKPTLYKQFVGGETLQDCSAAINHLMKYNVKSTLDYSAESEQTPEGIQATFEETLRSIDFAKGNTNLAYAVFKPSTITTDELLAKASEKREELTIDDVRTDLPRLGARASSESFPASFRPASGASCRGKAAERESSLFPARPSPDGFPFLTGIRTKISPGFQAAVRVRRPYAIAYGR